MSVSGEALCGRDTHAPAHLSRDNCFDLCSEGIRPSELDVTGWHVTWIQANKRAEGKNIKGSFQAFGELSNCNNGFAPGGKSDPAGMFILDRKEAVIVITSRPLFRCNFRAASILTAIPRTGQVGRPAMRLCEHFHAHVLFFSPVNFAASI